MGAKGILIRALVTGGGGFLGLALTQELINQGHQVHTYSRGDYPILKKIGASHFQGDLNDFESLLNAAKGCEVIFHVAAKAGIWGKYQDFYDCNVKGTKTVLRVCESLGIDKLIYTSSPSVVHGGEGIEGGSEESLPYPKKFEAPYPQTKAIAEQLVLEANGPKLATIALRPHLIWGPGDHHFLPRLIAKAKTGRLRLIGMNDPLVDCLYIDNAVQAHLKAYEALEKNPLARGRAYFITQGTPIPISHLINQILHAGGVAPVTKRIPSKLAYAIAGLLELFYSVFKIRGEPPLTRFLVKQLSTPHWFDLSAAKKDLGYHPTISLDEGMRRLKIWIQKR